MVSHNRLNLAWVAVALAVIVSLHYKQFSGCFCYFNVVYFVFKTQTSLITS